MKFGTIGTNWITETFIKSANLTKMASLHAVYSRNEATAKTLADRYGAKHSYTDLKELLQSEIDFVYIASPNSLHFEHILMAISYGKHVFCEKPLVYTEKQWREIEQAAKKKKVFIFEGYRHLFSPNYKRLKKHLNNIGQVRSAILHYVQYSSRYDAFKEGLNPNVFSKDFAGGALMDLGVYPLSLALDLFGEPQQADYFPVLLHNGIDGSGTLILTYDQFNITIISSKIAQGTIPSEIHGEEGSLTIDRVAPIQSLTLYKHQQATVEQLAVEQDEMDMIYQITAFVEMVKQRDLHKHDEWMERSRLVAKWTEKARKQAGILFPLDESND